ncbi:hypothetical protein TWF696_001422 [Orbilia brochopaga]|uniref:Uncharacterized protein n=1 Tax=Orbilia brochopaga TaxID=3140254 RepID=A0AAV9UC58_9PEZI
MADIDSTGLIIYSRRIKLSFSIEETRLFHIEYHAGNNERILCNRRQVVLAPISCLGTTAQHIQIERAGSSQSGSADRKRLSCQRDVSTNRIAMEELLIRISSLRPASDGYLNKSLLF